MGACTYRPKMTSFGDIEFNIEFFDVTIVITLNQPEVKIVLFCLFMFIKTNYMTWII